MLGITLFFLIVGAEDFIFLPHLLKGEGLFFILRWIFLIVLFFSQYLFVLRKGKTLYKKKYYFLAYTFLLILFFPLLGLAGAIFIYLNTTYLKSRFKEGVFEDYTENIVEVKMPSSFRRTMLDNLSMVREETSFEPFINIIESEDENMKLKLLDKLSSPNPFNIQLIKKAQKDPSYEVRLYAATTLAKLDSYFQKRIEEAISSAQEKARPLDFAYLAESYRHYVESGLVDEKMRRYYLSLACEAYEKSLDIETNQPSLVLNYVRSLMEIEEYLRAKKILDRAVKVWPDNYQMIFLRAKTYFMLGDFKKVQEIFLKVQGEKYFVDNKMRLVWQFWARREIEKN